MKNKKFLSVIAATLTVVILVGGTLAFFTATDSDDVEAKVGTVSVEVEANLTHTQLKRDKWAMLEYQMNNGVSAIMSGEEESQPTIEEQRVMLESYFDAAPNNINPGDNDHSYWEYDNEPMPRPGTDHELEINIKNTGTKSVETRILVQITNKTQANISPALYLPTPLMENIFVAYDPYTRLSGATSLHFDDLDSDFVFLKKMNFPTTKTINEDNTVVYCFDSELAKAIVNDQEISNVNKNDRNYNDYYGYYYMQYLTTVNPFVTLPSDAIASGLIFSGIGKNAETEKYVIKAYAPTEIEEGIQGQDQEIPTELKTLICPKEGTFKLDLGMLFDEYGDANALEGQDLEITVTVQAIQYRNTSEATWETVFEEKFNVGTND